MATYTTVADLLDYLEDAEGEVRSQLPIRADDAAVVQFDPVIQRAERRVDLALGPYALRPSGLKLDPEALTEVQRAALSRATCAAVEHELRVGFGFYAGDDEWLPAGLTPLRSATRTPPKVLDELAGVGLVRKSGCVTTPEAA